MTKRKHPGRPFASSLVGFTEEERRLAESIAGGRRYPDRAMTRGRVKKARRQREAAERAALRC